MSRNLDDELISAIEDAETVGELQAALRDVPPDVVLEFHEDGCEGGGDGCCQVEKITVGEFAPRSQA